MNRNEKSLTYMTSKIRHHLEAFPVPPIWRTLGKDQLVFVIYLELVESPIPPELEVFRNHFIPEEVP